MWERLDRERLRRLTLVPTETETETETEITKTGALPRSLE